MKKVLIVIFAMVMLISSLSIDAVAAEPTVIYTPSVSEVKPGDEVTVVLSFADFEKVTAYLVALHYDDSVISLAKDPEQIFSHFIFDFDPEYNEMICGLPRASKLSGDYLRFTFKVSETAKAGSEIVLGFGTEMQYTGSTAPDVLERKTVSLRVMADSCNHIGEKIIKNEKPATCTEKGYTGDIYCSSCGEKLEDGKPIDMIAHTLSKDWSSNDDLHWQKCTECGTEMNKEAHAYEWTVEKEPTEEAQGIKKGICSVCGFEKQEKIPELSHVHKAVLVEETPATCVEAGTKAHWHCSGCDKNFEDEACEKELDSIVIPIDPDNHAGKTEIRDYIEATDKTEGYTGDTWCLDCGKMIKEGKIIPITLVRPIFDDKIALEYAVELPTVTEAPKVTLSVDGVKMSSTTAIQTEDGKWSFTCLDIVPSKLDAQITVEVEGADVEIPSYSVKEYCEERLENSEDDTYKQLVSDLLRYGAVAQEYETGKPSSIDDVNGIFAPVDVEKYESIFEQSQSQKKVWKGATLVLDNTITMRLYYQGDVAPSIDDIKCSNSKHSMGVDHKVTINTEKKYVQITGFTPLDYDDVITATLDGETITYSVGSYIARKSVNSDNEITKKIVTALQNYGRAAEAYDRKLKN